MDETREDRIEELFEAAVLLPREQRARFVMEACRGDAALRSEVFSLLEHADGAGEALQSAVEHVVEAVAGALVGERSAADDDPLIGRRIGHYLILDRLGAGGMGRVYRARDVTLDRLVALKFLPRRLGSDPAARRRVIAEAKAASVLDHPNICTIHEVAEADLPGDPRHGSLFIAMPCYDGETIATKLARGPLPIEEAVAYAVQVADALVAAGDAGLVHRDLKPANLIVTQDGRIRILDFGVATSAVADVTTEGATRGTLAYMSPEQTRGEAVDARSDQWSLGVVLYEMLTGVRPFQGGDPALLVHQIRHESPAPLAGLRPDAPDALARIVERCLRQVSDERYAHAGELLAELRAVRAGEGVDRAQRRQVRPQRVAVVAVVGALALAIAALLMKPGREGDRSVGVPGAAADATGEAMPRLTVLPFASLRADTATVAFAVDPTAYHLYLRSFGYPFVTEEGNRAAYALLRRAAALDSTYAPAMTALGYRAFLLGYHGFTDEPEPALEEAERAFEKALALDPQDLQALSYRGLLLLNAGRLEEALRPLRQALTIQPNADSYISLGHVYRQAGLLEESVRSFERAAALDPTNHRLNLAGTAYQYLGRYAEAMEAFMLDPYSPPSLAFQGLLLLEWGRPEAAAERFEALVAGGQGGPWFGLPAESLLAWLDGDRARARERIRALERHATESGGDGEGLYLVARLYALLDDRASALRMAEQAVDRGFFAYPFLVTDPFMDSIRDDAAFQTTLAKARTRHEAFRDLVYPGNRGS
jgi:tetratricopeptide (TPR) repeat protein